MFEHNLHALRLAAIGGNQVGEIRMPAHSPHVVADSGDFSLDGSIDVRTDLESGMIRYSGMRITDIDLRRGFAQTLPCLPHRLVDAVEIPVIAFRIVGDDVRMLVQPCGDSFHVDLIERVTIGESGVVHAILAIQPYDAVEGNGNRVEYHAHVGRRPTRTDEDLHAFGLQRSQRVNGGLRYHMRHKTGQRAVDVEKRRLDVVGVMHGNNLS